MEVTKRYSRRKSTHFLNGSIIRNSFEDIYFINTYVHYNSTKNYRKKFLRVDSTSKLRTRVFVIIIKMRVKNLRYSEKLSAYE